MHHHKIPLIENYIIFENWDKNCVFCLPLRFVLQNCSRQFLCENAVVTRQFHEVKLSFRINFKGTEIFRQKQNIGFLCFFAFGQKCMESAKIEDELVLIGFVTFKNVER